MATWLRTAFHLLLWLPMLLCHAPVQATEAKDAEASYSLMVMGFTAPNAERGRWMAVMQQVVAATGVSIRLQTPASLSDFERRVLNGDPDFAFIDPYLMARAYHAHGYLPLVRDGSRLQQGVILVRQDSPIRSLQALEGTTISFPAANTFPASLQIRQILARERIVSHPRFAGTFSNTLRQVLYGETQAAATTMAALSRERPEVQSQLRIVYVAPPVSSYVLAAHPRVPAASRRGVSAALLGMSESVSGRRLLGDVELTQPVAAHYESDYRPLEMLGLASFLWRGDE